MEANETSILEDMQEIKRLADETAALTGKDPLTYSTNMFGMPEEEIQDNPELMYLNWLEFKDPENVTDWHRERIEALRALVVADIDRKRQYKLISKLTEPSDENH